MRTRAGLIGDPVSHSLSPRIFKAVSARLGRKVSYEAFRVRPMELECVLRKLKAEGFSGLNVTIPHKVAAARHLSSLTSEARLIGAVNAVRFSRASSRGHNTDAAGFADALRETGFEMAGKDAVVFGTGGAARAVGLALASLKARRVRFTGRSPARARTVARLLRRTRARTRFEAGGSRSAALWVNATPLGMKGFPDKAPFKGRARCELAFDLVYGRRTAFLKKAAASGAQAVGGMSMLVYQALRSWEFWFKPLGAARRRDLKNDIIKRIQ
ncbi:MAG: shikimate dehydrogenase [Elusimicrobiota bacterium]